jgi:photosynthetic reaction center cytochrome c subunit
MIKGHSLTLAGFALGTAVLLGGCEFGQKEISQTGFRGTGMAQLVNTDLKVKDATIPPPPYPLGPDEGPRARETYQNLQVLGDLSTDEFNRLMISITEWVAPAQGCNYCHNPADMASDEVYTKVVSRRMLQMTRDINASWSSHVQQTGVTCYTCHRGNNVPEHVWSLGPAGDRMSIRGNKRGQNTPDPNVGYASLPFDPFAKYLRGDVSEIRVSSSSRHPSPNHKVSIQDTEGSYGLMMHLSSALGVNCTYCHNSQSFRSWGNSRQQRATAFYGIRMVRSINAGYIDPLASVFPTNRLGPQGDALKVNCATCHQGQAKPLGGVSMLKDHPALGPRPVAVTPTPAEVQITPTAAVAPAAAAPASAQ